MWTLRRGRSALLTQNYCCNSVYRIFKSARFLLMKLLFYFSRLFSSFVLRPVCTDWRLNSAGCDVGSFTGICGFTSLALLQLLSILVCCLSIWYIVVAPNAPEGFSCRLLYNCVVTVFCLFFFFDLYVGWTFRPVG